MSDIQYFRITGELKKECNIWLKKTFLPGADIRGKYLEENFPGFRFTFKATKLNHKKPVALRGDGIYPRCFKRSKHYFNNFNPNTHTVGGRKFRDDFDSMEFECQPSTIVLRIKTDTFKAIKFWYSDEFAINYVLGNWYLRVSINSLRNLYSLPSYLVPVHVIDYHRNLIKAKESNSFILLES